MKIGLTLSIILVLAATANAQITSDVPTAYTASLAGAGIAISNNSAAISNEASTLHITKYAAGIGIENRFGVKELSTKYAFGVYALPKDNRLGLVAQQFGTSDYNNLKIGVLYAKKLNNVDIGFRANFHQLSIPEYGAASAFSVQGGAIWHYNDKNHLAFYITNPSQTRFAKNVAEVIPTTLKIGYRTVFSAKVFTVLQADKNLHLPIDYKAGIEYLPISALSLRVGFSTLYKQGSIGFGYTFGAVRIDVATSYHPILGYTPTVSLVINGN